MESMGAVPVTDFGCPMYEVHKWDGDPKHLELFGCQVCDANYMEWIVDDRDWWRLPRKMRKLRLCTDCFAKAVGLTPARTGRERFPKS